MCYGFWDTDGHDQMIKKMSQIKDCTNWCINPKSYSLKGIVVRFLFEYLDFIVLNLAILQPFYPNS